MTAAIEFRYVAMESREASEAPELPCAGLVSIHPSWWGFSQVAMAPLATGIWGAVRPFGCERDPR